MECLVVIRASTGDDVSVRRHIAASGPTLRLVHRLDGIHASAEGGGQIRPGQYSTVINVAFTEVTGSSDPDINFGLVNFSGTEAGQGGWSYSFTTNGSGQVTSKTLDSFAVFANNIDITTQNIRNLLLHEIGHALTLKPPGAYDVGGQIPPGPYLPTGEEFRRRGLQRTGRCGYRASSDCDA